MCASLVSVRLFMRGSRPLQCRCLLLEQRFPEGAITGDIQRWLTEKTGKQVIPYFRNTALGPYWPMAEHEILDFRPPKRDVRARHMADSFYDAPQTPSPILRSELADTPPKRRRVV